jgi:hypothetical protein
MLQCHGGIFQVLDKVRDTTEAIVPKMPDSGSAEHHLGAMLDALKIENKP